tara:strand:+ start:73 stop:666 length:594 start_codon:yes stop_codon:yes gene_type:complete
MLKINGTVKNKEFKRILKYILKNNSSKTNIIEIFGVDGSGKTFLSSKILKELLKNQKKKIKIIHLWRFTKNKRGLKKIIPYRKLNYIYPISLIKEIYLIMKMIFLAFNIFIFFDKENFYIFERSIYDVFIDPSRYRLSHKPILFKIFYNIIFKNTKKIYINASYNLVKKRKDELTKKKYIILKYKLDKLFDQKNKSS